MNSEGETFGAGLRPAFADAELRVHKADAMKTTFRIFTASKSAVVESAISEAFHKLDEIEGLLSRYIPGSDVSRINALKRGESLIISDECDACLRLALEAFQITGGLFDPCAGALVDAVKSGSGVARPFSGRLALDPARPRVDCIEAGRVVDLGGIGKGFALERMASVLTMHGIDDALLTSGASTMLAMGEKSWPVEIPHSTGARRIELCQSALGASGNTQQGIHIVDPVANRGATHHLGVWVEHPRAAFADAFSTACFVMSSDEISVFRALLASGCRIICDPDWDVPSRCSMAG